MPLFNGWTPFGYTGVDLDAWTWRAQRETWRAQRRAWRAQRRLDRAQWRAQHHGAFGFIWGFIWTAFWISFALFMVVGGPEARHMVFQLVQSFVHAIKGVVQDLLGAVGAVQ